jgi:hypothetical protein
MTSWSDVCAAVPDLAERGEAILTATTNAVLGTLRADGSPRLSGIDPTVWDGEIWLGSMPGARKGDDLRRDPRLSLHGIPWESRKVKDGATDPGEGDVKVTGRAVPVTDPEAFRRFVAHFSGERGFDPPEPFDLFTVDVESVVVIAVADDQLVVDRWSPAGGRVTVARS